jgi:nitrate reductase NapAB chaperone NapD
MPIFSYLAMPKKGAKEALCTELASLDYCQILPAKNQDVIVLVTETPDEIIEKSLQTTLKELQSLQSLSLAFGYNETIDKGE